MDAPYEPPENPDLVLDTTGADIDDLVDQVLAVLYPRERLSPAHLSDDEDPAEREVGAAVGSRRVRPRPAAGSVPRAELLPLIVGQLTRAPA